LNVIADLCQQAEIDSTELDAVIIGLAGVWLEEEKMRSTQLMKTLARSQNLVLNDLLVVSDAELALEGAFQGEPGIVLIVGTGSIALAKTGKDQLMRCGGWGIELDDEGSGAWIGREGLTGVVRAIDGRGEPTILTKQLSEMFPTIDIKQPRTIVKAYAERSFEYQMLTPIVMKAAEKGDKVCLDIIQRSALHLMELLQAMKKHYKTKKVNVALMGGIIDADTLLAKLLDKEIAKDKVLTRIKPKGSAIDGAIAMGLKLINEME
jgi:N-acetylglucosamine kinase-like BadF-type ATPase